MSLDNEYQIVGVKLRPAFRPTAITGSTRSYVLGSRTNLNAHHAARRCGVDLPDAGHTRHTRVRVIQDVTIFCPKMGTSNLFKNKIHINAHQSV